TRIPFPGVAGDEQAAEVVRRVRAAVEQSPELRLLNFVEISSLSPLDRHLLVERHLISPRHAQDVKHKAVVLRVDEVVRVMVNEEDHVLMQVRMPGLQLIARWERADKLDDAFAQHLPYAFKQDRGYLTACPTDVGTELRASVMVH